MTKQLKATTKSNMVFKWPSKNPFTLDERKKIREGIDLKMSYRQIAYHCGRSKTGVLREVKRNGGVESYDAELSQFNFEEKQRKFMEKQCQHAQEQNIKTT